MFNSASAPPSTPFRFGVEQRGRLLAKASPAPHVLHMTATPIPRTQVRACMDVRRCSGSGEMWFPCSVVSCSRAFFIHPDNVASTLQALIDHGDMSLVLIQELPAGRSPVVTRALRDDRPEQREQVGRRGGAHDVRSCRTALRCAALQLQLQDGAFWLVCPATCA